MPDFPDTSKLLSDLDSAVVGPIPPPPDRPTSSDATHPSAVGELPGNGSAPPGYRIERELGRGGMGVVVLAEQVRLRRFVALKCLRPEHLAGAEQLARFRTEAEAAARLQHPNIVQIFEVGAWRPTADGPSCPFLTMEYVPGATLAERLRDGPWPPRQAAELVETLARAIQYAHAQGIVHRDLKPANILLPSGPPEFFKQNSGGLRPPLSELGELVPKIADFGLAKRLDGAAELTQSGAILGTPSYMAPEQATSRADVGPAVDVYALGAILYEMLTGRPPFRAASVLETLEQVRTADPLPPRAFQPKVPRDLDTVCRKCLHKDPARRYRTAADLADDLRRFLDGRPIVARPIGRGERAWKWVRRNPAAAGFVMFLAAAAAGGVAGTGFHLRSMSAALEQTRLQETETRKQKQQTDELYRQARNTVRQMLEHFEGLRTAGIPRLRELHRRQAEDALAFLLAATTGRDESDPEARYDVAKARHEAGRLQYFLGRFDEGATTVLTADAAFAGLADEFPADGRYQMERVQALALLSSWHDLRRRPQDSLDCLTRALELAEGLCKEAPAERDRLRLRAATHNQLGGLYFNRKDHPPSERHFRAAADQFAALLAGASDDRRLRSALGHVHVNLSVLCMQDAARLVEATAHHDSAVRTFVDLLQSDPGDEDALLTLTQHRTNWAYALANTGRFEDAVADLADNDARLTALVRREPDFAEAKLTLLRTHGAWANLLEKRDDQAGAATHYDRVVALAEPARQPFYRLLWVNAVVRSGDHARAFAEVQARAALPEHAVVDHQVHFAMVCARAATAVRRDEQLATSERDALEERYTLRAVELLAGAKTLAGAEAWPKHAAEVTRDEAFRPLLERADFQRVVRP